MKNTTCQLVSSHSAQLWISFLFQAEMSMDRCKDIRQLREYFAFLWPDDTIEKLLAVCQNKGLPTCRFSLGCGLPFVVLMQWFVFKRVRLPMSKILEAENCIRSFVALLRGSDVVGKESFIAMRMRLYSAATSLCAGLPLPVVQSFRKIEHLNSAPHLSLRPFNAERCGILKYDNSL